MAFVPYKSAAKDDDNPVRSAPLFSKKPARKRKNRKAAPAQKALMQSGRSLGGGGR